jgi:micrococcal nuclease
MVKKLNFVIIYFKQIFNRGRGTMAKKGQDGGSLSGCLGLLVVLFLISLVIAIVKWTIANILGVIGIIAAIVGIGLMIQKQKKYISIPTLLFGILLALLWFAFKEPLNVLAMFFFLAFLAFLIAAIILGIKRNPVWKKLSAVSTGLFILFFIFSLNAPNLDVDDVKESKTVNVAKVESTETEKEQKSNENEQTKAPDDNEKKNALVSVPSSTTPDKNDEKAKEEQAKQEAAKKQQEQEELAKRFNLEAVTVARVIDGDTFELSDGRKVRLVGVNTPESTTRHEEYGKEASNYTSSKLTGKKIWMQKDVSDMDRYGRLLRIVWLEVPSDDMNESEIRKKMFNANLVINGYAEPSTYPPDVKYADYFRKFAREAREKNTGLWAFGEYGTTKGDLDPKQTTSSNTNSSSNNNSSTSSSTNSSNSNTNTTTKQPSSGGSEYFKNCTELRKVYPNGVPADHPAYQPKLDRDKDNYACER